LASADHPGNEQGNIRELLKEPMIRSAETVALIRKMKRKFALTPHSLLLLAGTLKRCNSEEKILFGFEL
jgi:hypothetical protein